MGFSTFALGWLSLCLFAPVLAEARFLAAPRGETRALDFERPTHLVVAGYADGAGDEFVKAAISRMERLRSAYPEDQILLYRSNEEDFDDARDSLRAYGLRILEQKEEDLSAGNFLASAARFPRIRSIAFFSHSGPFNGVRMGEDSARISKDTKGLEKLVGKFTPDAHVQLFGCNGAISVAPFLTKKWGVPVTGGLTGGPFEGLYSDGKWYVNGEEAGRGSAWASKNQVSYDAPLSCALGGCIRVKPQNSQYDSTWGTWHAGLGFFKFFCDRYDVDPDACHRAMAQSLLGFVSTKNLKMDSPLSDWKEVLQDWLCPSSGNPAVRRKCVSGLENAIATGDETLNVFYGNPIECSMSRCDFSMTSEERGGFFSARRTVYELFAPSGRSPRTVVQEYKRFLRGIELLLGSTD